MNLSEMTAIVAEINRALDERIQWVEDHDSMREHGAIAHTGRVLQNDGGGWIFTLVEFPIEDKIAVRGTAVRLGMIVNLPPALAEKALMRARSLT